MDVGFVFFDLDDTLLDHRHAERAALADLRETTPPLRDVPLERIVDVYHGVNRVVWEDYGAGRIDKAAAKRLRFERLFGALHLNGPDPAAAGDEYLELYARHWRYRDGALEAFRSVAGALPVGILTNGFAEVQRSKLARFPDLAHHASVTVISEEVGMMKPDPALFDWASRQAGLPAARILYVGDSLRSDIRGGHAAGWQVAWIDGDPEEAPEGTLCFSDWSRLTATLLPASGA